MRTHFTSLIARALVFFLGAALVACGDGGKTSPGYLERDRVGHHSTSNAPLAWTTARSSGAR